MQTHLLRVNKNLKKMNENHSKYNIKKYGKSNNQTQQKQQSDFTILSNHLFDSPHNANHKKAIFHRRIVQKH